MTKQLFALVLVAFAVSGCGYQNWSRMDIGPRPDQPSPNSYWCYTDGSNRPAPWERRGPGVGWCIPPGDARYLAPGPSYNPRYYGS